MQKQLLSIDDLTDSEVSRLFFAARSSQELPVFSHRPILLTSFFEPSTRTRLSFEMAALSLGLQVSHFDALSSSMKKGETWEETMSTLDALGPDLIVCRVPFQLDRQFLSALKSPIINGGDGINEHPTQALLDCYTLLEHFGCDDLHNKRILIIGDIAHSRVAHSNIKLMTRLGAKVSLLSPPSFASQDHSLEALTHFNDVEGNFDVAMTLRIQKERLVGGCQMSDDEYFKAYGLDLSRFLELGKNCVLLHPGPMNIATEISANVVCHPRSLIRRQVKNGVNIRLRLMQDALQA